MIRLLMGITLSEAGGSQRVVYDIISNLPENLYEITLVTSPGGELLDWIAGLNKDRTNRIKVITPPWLKRNISILHDMMALLKMLSIMAKTKYDIAHFHNSKMGIIGRLAAKIAGIPSVYYTVHGWGLNRKTTGRLYGAMNLVERVVSRLSTEVVFVSNSDMETGIRNRWASRSASRLIYNGIADVQAGQAGFRESLGIAGELPVIVFVARLAEPKDPLFAIRVSGHLKAGGLEHRMVVIGGGPMHDDCVRLVEELGLGCHVKMLGQRSDVRVLLMEADIFCLFTKWEGLPVSIIEAMYASLPVVASNVGGVPELVEHNKTGYLLDSFKVEKAAEQLAALINDKELRLAMGNAGRVAALERFRLDSMIAGYRQLYENHDLNMTFKGRAI